MARMCRSSRRLIFTVGIAAVLRTKPYPRDETIFRGRETELKRTPSSLVTQPTGGTYARKHSQCSLPQLSPELDLRNAEVRGVKHRTVDFGVQEVEPGRWRWLVSPAIGAVVQGPVKYRTREQAVAAGIEEINNGIERTRRRSL